jgi:hypothetical protein
MANKFQRLTSPKGIARFPWLNKPDTKFSEVGDYKVDLVLSAKDAAPLIQRVEAIRDAFAKKEGAKKKANLPWVDEVDDNGNKTGNVIVKFKVKAMTGDWDRKPKLFDAKGSRIVEAAVGGGSVLKVSFDAYTWNVASLGAGITLQPVAVQVLELVEFEGGGDASEFGFGEEEGYEATDELGEDLETDAEGEDEDVF